MINLLYSIIHNHIKKGLKIRIFKNPKNFNPLGLENENNIINRKDYAKIRKILFYPNILNYELTFNLKNDILILDIYNIDNSYYHFELSCYNLKQVYKNIEKIEYSLNKEKFLKDNLIL